MTPNSETRRRRSAMDGEDFMDSADIHKLDRPPALFYFWSRLCARKARPILSPKSRETCGRSLGHSACILGFGAWVHFFPRHERKSCASRLFLDIDQVHGDDVGQTLWVCVVGCRQLMRMISTRMRSLRLSLPSPPPICSLLVPFHSSCGPHLVANSVLRATRKRHRASGCRRLLRRGLCSSSSRSLRARVEGSMAEACR
jgi:hypothetical protein